MSLFSVIVATFNRAGLLVRTLESVRRQTFTDYEVIVVDDGSTDDTLERLRGFPEVKVFTQQNQGPGAARNLGVRQCSGQYLAFLDSDDVWFAWSLETYAAVIRRHDAPAFIAGKPLRFEREEQLAGAAGGPLDCERFADYYASGDEWRWWGVSSFVIRADALRAAGGFAVVNMNGEDADLAMKLGTAPGFVQVTRPFTFGYREHGGNVTANLDKSLAGVWHKVRSEQTAAYPGGATRARERWNILTRHARPVALEALRRRMKPEAWALYRATFRWHCALGRWKYLAAFPLKALLS